MIGELTASLHHDVTPPNASARNNARAAVNTVRKARIDQVSGGSASTM
jgi:hypothetical protein